VNTFLSCPAKWYFRLADDLNCVVRAVGLSNIIYSENVRMTQALEPHPPAESVA
jgi:hypothetical protein